MTPQNPSVDLLASHLNDVGQSAPTGLTLTLVLFAAAALLVRSMTKHLKRVPTSFEPQDDIGPIPDDASEFVDPGPQPGEALLDSLRRAPRAIEPPRGTDDGRPDTPGKG